MLISEEKLDITTADLLCKVFLPPLRIKNEFYKCQA